MDLPFREIVDLGHEMYSGMPNIGGAPVQFWPIYTHAKQEKITGGRVSMESRMILMPEHASTHLDVPRHCVEGATDVAGVPLQRLVLPGHLVDLRHKGRPEAVTIEDLEQAIERSGRPIEAGEAFIAWTGADAYWGEPGYTTERPYFPVETARWLVRQRIGLFGTDLIGMDDPSEWWWPTHRTWLEADICMVQQMRNLGALEGKDFVLVVAPLKMRDGTGCPVRPVALVL